MLGSCGRQGHLRAEHAHGADARAHRAWQARPQRAARLRTMNRNQGVGSLLSIGGAWPQHIARCVSHDLPALLVYSCRC